MTSARDGVSKSAQRGSGTVGACQDQFKRGGIVVAIKDVKLTLRLNVSPCDMTSSPHIPTRHFGPQSYVAGVELRHLTTVSCHALLGYRHCHCSRLRTNESSRLILLKWFSLGAMRYSHAVFEVFRLIDRSTLFLPPPTTCKSVMKR
jgi:hypothetical protein